jgi:hypothetical protein
VLVAVVAAHFFLDGAIKKSVETFGPEFTKVSVKLDSANVILFSGSGSIKGLVVGNPEPYKSPTSISLGVASLAIDPASLISDKIVINSINIQSPEVTFETDLKGNNLNKILANVQAATGGDQKSAPADKSMSSGSSKKLQVNDFLMKGGKIHVTVTSLGGRSTSVPLPEIHLKNLGTGPDGITAAELTKLVIGEIESKAVTAAEPVVNDLIKEGATVITKDLGKAANGAATNAADKITKGIGNLFKK